MTKICQLNISSREHGTYVSEDTGNLRCIIESPYSFVAKKFQDIQGQKSGGKKEKKPEQKPKQEKKEKPKVST